jgi:hypothetical protein
MRKISLMFLLDAAVFATSALAQEPVCNEPRAEGIARSELGACIAAPTGANVEVEVTALCECPEFGISVLAIARQRCNPNETCPPFGILIGSVQLDCDYNVIGSTCF